jgi:hypothetical protein
VRRRSTSSPRPDWSMIDYGCRFAGLPLQEVVRSRGRYMLLSGGESTVVGAVVVLVVGFRGFHSGAGAMRFRMSVGMGSPARVGQPIHHPVMSALDMGPVSPSRMTHGCGSRWLVHKEDMADIWSEARAFPRRSGVR